MNRFITRKDAKIAAIILFVAACLGRHFGEVHLAMALMYLAGVYSSAALYREDWPGAEGGL